MMYSKSTNNLYSIDEYDFYFNWIFDCPPNTQCWLSYQDCSFCESLYCHKHGKEWRQKTANKILSWGTPSIPTYRVINNIGVMLLPSHLRLYRKKYHYYLKKEDPNMGILWRFHFKNNRIHIDQTISSYSNRLNLANEYAHDKALSYIFSDRNSHQRTYCKPVRDYAGSISYIFEVSKDSNGDNSPPRMDGTAWHTWDNNNAFLSYLN